MKHLEIKIIFFKSNIGVIKNFFVFLYTRLELNSQTIFVVFSQYKKIVQNITFIEY